jgi:Raf kinase inhibitor-like YbhB/YbcL family protein
MKKVLVAVAIATLTIAGSVHAMSAGAKPNTSGVMTLTSPDFHNLGKIPEISGAGLAFGPPPCPGNNTPLTLTWTNVPQGTVSLLLTMVDYMVPGGPGFFVHWIQYNIPPTATGFSPSSQVGSPGLDSAGISGYVGPCPPPIPPQPHVYTITLYALDNALPSQPSAVTLSDYEALLSEINDHALAVAPFAGTFGTLTEKG